MFNNAINFNQNLNDWALEYDDYDNGRDFIGMFSNCTALDFHMTGWDRKFAKKDYNFDIYDYFGGAELMIRRYVNRGEEEEGVVDMEGVTSEDLNREE